MVSWHHAALLMLAVWDILKNRIIVHFAVSIYTLRIMLKDVICYLLLPCNFVYPPKHTVMWHGYDAGDTRVFNTTSCEDGPA